MFDRAIGFVLGDIEGGCTADGLTKWAVDRTKHPEITDAQWKAWTRDDSAAVLKTGYWDRYQCDSMPWPWALGIFDGVVNEGGVAVGYAQSALGLRIDNTVGPATLKAMAGASNEQFWRFLALRVKAYSRLSAFPVDGLGWIKRVIGVAWNGGFQV